MAAFTLDVVEDNASSPAYVEQGRINNLFGVVPTLGEAPIMPYFSARDDSPVNRGEATIPERDEDDLVVGILTRFPRSVRSLPIEVVLMIFQYSKGMECLCLRLVCRYFNVVLLSFCVEHLQAQLQPSQSTWTMTRATVKLKKRYLQKRLQQDIVASSPLNPITDAVGSGDSVYSNSHNSNIIDNFPQLSVDVEDDPLAQQMISVKPSGNEDLFRKLWIDEMAHYRTVKHNVRHALFNYDTIEKQSHTAPLVLPDGTLCFSRWQLIALYARIIERDKNGNEIANSQKWVKAGYLGSHTDTITSMQYDCRSGAMFSSSYDGSIKRWAIRDNNLSFEERSRLGLLACTASYQITLNGIPTNLFQIFSFDLMNLVDYDLSIAKEPVPSSTLPLNVNSALICCGTESGHVAILYIDERHSSTLGLYATSESRVRQIKFLNKFVFPVDTPQQEEGIDEGLVQIVVATSHAVHFLSHKIFRKVVDFQHNSDEENNQRVLRRGYHYFSTTLQIARGNIAPFNLLPMSFDVPRPFIKKYTDTEPIVLKSNSSKAKKQLLNSTLPQTNSFPDGNPFFQIPCAVFFSELTKCGFATVTGPPDDIQCRLDTLSDATIGATCGKFSPTNAFFVFGTCEGQIKISIVVPLTLAKSVTEREYFPPDLGAEAYTDSFSQGLVEKYGATWDFEAGFATCTMAVAHDEPVQSLTVDEWKISSIDAHSTVHVYDIAAMSLLFRISQHPQPGRCGLMSAQTVRTIIEMDCLSRPRIPRHVVWHNGTMVASPIPVTNHTLLCDFSGYIEQDCRHFADTRQVICSPDSAVGQLSVEKRTPEQLIVPCVPMQRVPFAFHLLYIAMPPVMMGLLALLTLLVSLRLDNFISWPFFAIFVVHFVLLPHYFGINLYCYKPLIAHHTGVSYLLRVIADGLYLVVEPILVIMKTDTQVFDELSWVILTLPLSVSMILALIAARLEDWLESRHHVTLNPAATLKRQVHTIVSQTYFSLLLIAVITCTSMFFDGPRDPDHPWKSLSMSSSVALLSPIVIDILAYCPSVSSYVNKPTVSTCAATMKYIFWLSVAYFLYCAVSLFPAILLILKYAHYYEYLEMGGRKNVTTYINLTSSSEISFDLWNSSNRTSANVTQIVRQEEMLTGVGFFSHIPFVALTFPLVCACLVVCCITAVNLHVHIKQLRRRR